MPQTIVFKSLFSGSTHIFFEASIINMYTYMNPSTHFYFLGNCHQIKNVLEFVNRPDLIHPVVCNFKSPSLISIFYFFNIFYFPHALKIDLSGNFGTPFYFFSANQDIVFQHHPWWNISTRKLKNFFCWLNFKISIFFKPKILVLGKWIFDNIQSSDAYSKREKSFFSWITHPFLIEKYLNTSSYMTIDCFWFFGKQDLFYKWKNDYQKIVSELKNNNVNVFECVSGAMELDEYYNKFKQTGYVVITYLQNYLFSCSGVFIDSIINLKPVICLESWMANYFFDKYGDIWFICKNLDDLIDKILLFQKYSPEEKKSIYESHVKNINLAKHDIMSVEKVSAEYINNIFIYEY